MTLINIKELQFINLFADGVLFSVSGINEGEALGKTQILLDKFDVYIKINKLKLIIEKQK